MSLIVQGLRQYGLERKIAAVRGDGGGRMVSRQLLRTAGRLLTLVCVLALPAAAQSFRVQCPPSTITHPAANNNTEPAYKGPTQFTRPTTGTAQWVVPTATTVNGAIKCQQVSGGDGFATMGDGTQTFMFSFGPLSGLAEIAAGHPGTQPPSGFNVPYPGCTDSSNCAMPLLPGDPASTDGAMSGASPWVNNPVTSPLFTWNGAVGITPDIAQIFSVSDLVAGSLAAAPPATAPHCPAPGPSTVTAYLFEPLGLPQGPQPVGTQIQLTIHQAPNIPGTTTPIIGSTPIPTQFLGTYAVTCVDNNVISPSGASQFAFQYTDAAAAGQGAQTALVGPTASTPAVLDGHVDPRQIIDIGVMNGNIPAPLVAFDEDDEMFLTLTNVILPLMPALTSGIATSPRPNTCRWAWWGSFTCARGRTASRQALGFFLTAAAAASIRISVIRMVSAYLQPRRPQSQICALFAARAGTSCAPPPCRSAGQPPTQLPKASTS
jgi:hypothetical protein